VRRWRKATVNTLKNLSGRTNRRRNARLNARREARPAGRVKPIVAHPGRLKPKQPTILRRKTGRSLIYLVSRDLVNWDGSGNFIEPKKYYRSLDPITGEIVSKKIDDGSPTCGV
jgi:hypothetical protein